MSVDQVLNWIPGAGWLVLSGGRTTLSEIRANVLSRAKPDGGVAYIGLSVDDAEDVMDDMAELGAPTGYLVNVMTEDDETITDQITDASIIVISGDYDPQTLLSGLFGAAAKAIQSAYEGGTIVLAEGGAVSTFGQVLPFYPGRLGDGLKWVTDAVIIPGVTSVNQSTEARAALETHTAKIAIGIAEGSALVLGPGGQVETWGGKQVTVGLGGTADE